MNVYVDHYNEPIFEWIEEEENEDQDYRCEEDEDSVLSDTYFVDHEEDDVEYPFPANKTMGDRFLNKLCLHIVNVDDLYEDAEYVEPQYPVHDDRQPWNQMKPLLVITLLYDGHKGLLEAVKERCPEAEHRQCARHIVANFAKRKLIQDLKVKQRLWGVTPCGYQNICKEPSHNKKKCPSKQQTNTSAPSSSRGSGAGPSQPATAQPPPPPPPAAAAQPPQPPPAAAAQPPPPPLPPKGPNC
ncbi:unnamed protein product [Lactuca virosa]|uniref:MULE transposase domain-containing protein n=1 Tax=Lactuca virosa TaxID=75947 RepID=A0AAU9NFK5_9ASTR|nr:unnamed protein product [Lactuca virosa]